MGEVFVGTSGWSYQHWVGNFYPHNLLQKEWLSYYCKFFKTVEINASFYHLMPKKVFENWRRQVGEDFVFSIKANRYITHIKRLRDCSEELKRMSDSFNGVRNFQFSNSNFSRKLRDPAEAGQSNSKFKISKDIILFQLPPRWGVDIERLKAFLKLLSKNWRYAFEFRDKSWLIPEVYTLLRKRNCALVIQDSPYWPSVELITAEFVYLRFHGRESLYASCYTREELENWSEKIKGWIRKGLDVYAYFNNDAEGYAIRNAKELVKILGD